MNQGQTVHLLHLHRLSRFCGLFGPKLPVTQTAATVAQPSTERLSPRRPLRSHPLSD